VLWKAGIDSTLYHDYLEFYVGEELVKGGLLEDLKARGLVEQDAQSMPARRANDRAVLEVVHERIFKDPKMVGFMVRQMRPDGRAQAAAQLRAVGSIVHEKQAPFSHHQPSTPTPPRMIVVPKITTSPPRAPR
jgi:hypothetical protein